MERCLDLQCKVPFNPEIVSDVDIYLGLPHISYIKDTLHRDSISEEVLDSVEIYVKYAGYIDRELQLAQKIKNLENLSIPEDFDYSKVTSLSKFGTKPQLNGNVATIKC